MTEYQGRHEKEPIVGDAPPRAHVLFSNRAYDILKHVAQIWLPALAVLYISLGGLFELPMPQQISGAIMALDLFLGTILGISTRQYTNSDERFDGKIVLTPGEQEETTDLRILLNPEAIAEKNEVTVKVLKP